MQHEEAEIRRVWESKEKELWARVEGGIKWEEERVRKEMEVERRRIEEEERKAREAEVKRRLEEEKRRRRRRQDKKKKKYTGKSVGGGETEGRRNGKC